MFPSSFFPNAYFAESYWPDFDIGPPNPVPFVFVLAGHRMAGFILAGERGI